jgi:HSP20 family protein
MANITRYDPFSPFSDVTRFDPFRDIEEIFKDFRLNSPLREVEATPRIRIDVSETEHAYFVKADIPGVKKEEIKVAIEGNQVSINTDIKRDITQKEGENVVRTERYVGKQMRNFTLAHEVDDGQAEAKYQDGVLELVLPKKAGGKAGKQLVIR